MKSKRYYYTDPLAAAWMVRHHGINLQVHHSFKETDFGLLDVTALQVDALGMAIYIEASEPGGERRDFAFGDREGDCDEVGKLFYIHPDSMHLLEPRQGDVCHTNLRGGGVSVEELISDERAQHAGPHIIERGGRIIQRNGITFHWPEVEA